MRAGDSDFGILGERMDVFEKLPPHACYVTTGSNWSATAVTECVLAVCLAPGKGNRMNKVIGPEGVEYAERGKGTNLRQIYNIAMEGQDVADSLRTLRTGTMRMTFPGSPIWKRPTTIDSSRRAASASKGFSPMTAVWTKPSASRTTTSCWYRADIIHADRPSATKCTISTSWPDRSANGGSNPIPTSNGFTISNHDPVQSPHRGHSMIVQSIPTDFRQPGLVNCPAGSFLGSVLDRCPELLVA